MPRKKALNDAQSLELFEMVRKGFSNKDIAKKFGIAESTVGKYYRRTLAERGREAQKNGGGPRLVVVRERGARLTYHVDEGYVGHTTIGGVEDTCTFKANVDSEAIVKFDEWLEEMKAEQEFMDRIERRPAAITSNGHEYMVLDETGEQIEGARLEDVLDQYGIDATKMIELQEELAKRLSESNKRVAELESELSKRDARIAELEGAAVRSNPLEANNAMTGTAYAVLAVKPKIKGCGVYQDMDAAFAELDRLNEVAKMLDVDGAFEVHEMDWR